MNKKTPKNFREYAERFPREVRPLLRKMRLTVKRAAPLAKERISYGMPAYFQEGVLVWFAAYRGHVGFYPKPSGITAFKKELSGYKGAKGSVQFPFDRPLPLGLVGRIVKFRVKENLRKKERPR